MNYQSTKKFEEDYKKIFLGDSCTAYFDITQTFDQKENEICHQIFNGAMKQVKHRASESKPRLIRYFYTTFPFFCDFSL